MSSAKCHNYTGCLLAYRGEEIKISSGAPLVCPECGKPVTPVAGGGLKMLKNLLLAVVVLGLVGGGAWYVMNKKPVPPPEKKSSRRLASTGGTYGPQGKAGEVSNDTKPTEGQVLVVKEAVIDTEDPTVKETRTQVIQRIDQIPNLKEDERDKLVTKMNRAKQMGLLLVMPFGAKKDALAPNEAAALQAALKDPGLQEVRRDPTAVFVVLGFADAGAKEASIETSRRRAKNVVDVMKDKAGVSNLIHYVGMGKSNLTGTQGVDQNRVVEVWVVVPE